MDGILIALELMGYGLGGTFLALILLYGLIRVTGRVFKGKTDDNNGEW